MNNVGTKEMFSTRLILRKFKNDDKTELLTGYINQEEFLYYANKEKINEIDVENYLQKVIEKYSEDDYYNWAIILKESNTIIGSINLKVYNSNDSVEFNYAIDNRYTNKGYMTETLNIIKKFCLEELKVNRFQGGCCVENIASKRVMEKCNMDCEGILKRYIKLRDGYHDMYMYSSINENI